MTISPCAMLITPITPKVTASPIAASSRTEPSEIPYQRFWAALHSASRSSTSAIASCAAAFTASGRSRAASEPSSALASWSPRASITAMAATMSASAALVEDRSEAARACSSRRRTRSSVSALMAASSASNWSGSRLLNTFSAAASRWAGSGLIRVSAPSAARMVRRSALLMRILSTASRATDPTPSPVRGSTSA